MIKVCHQLTLSKEIILDKLSGPEVVNLQVTDDSPQDLDSQCLLASRPTNRLKSQHAPKCEMQTIPREAVHIHTKRIV